MPDKCVFHSNFVTRLKSHNKEISRRAGAALSIFVRLKQWESNPGMKDPRMNRGVFTRMRALPLG
jgi:hypothetical protein